MNFTHPVHQEMLVALTEGGVEYLLVGGYAVIFHGYIRGTGDMDVWLRPTNENKEKLLEVMSRLKFNADDVKTIADMDFTSVVIFHIGNEPERIDFLSRVQGLNFEDAYRNKVFLKIGDFSIPILRYEDLLTGKMASNRLKDRADVESLIKINNHKKPE